jgi:hypothetical protein
MSVSENDRHHHICATTYLWVLVNITFTLIAAMISAPATSVIKITILIMLVSTLLIFLLYVCYGAKVMKTRFGYMAIGTHSLVLPQPKPMLFIAWEIPVRFFLANI